MTAVLTEIQIRAVEVCAEHSDADAARILSGDRDTPIHRSTIGRWRKIPAFAEALRDALLDRSRARELRKAKGWSVAHEYLLQLVQDTEAETANRLAAAKILVEHGKQPTEIDGAGGVPVDPKQAAQNVASAYGFPVAPVEPKKTESEAAA